jgi:hypothetical protein
MSKLIAPCGLDCGACEAYLATVANDQAELEKIAAKWRVEFNAPDITAASVTCMGCNSESGPWAGNCSECEIRRCAKEHGYVTCAECTIYPCETLGKFTAMSPAAAANLESLRKG